MACAFGTSRPSAPPVTTTQCIAMRTNDWLRMTLLAAIWGLSFLFLRVAAPVLGPAPTAVSRLLIGGGLLALYVQMREGGINLRAYWRHYALLGMLNSGLPFLLFSFAAKSLPASYLILLNATTPLSGALVSAFSLGERLGARHLAALACGMVGVAIVAGLGPIAIGPQELIAIAAGLCAAACYALATIQIRRAAVRQSANTQAAMSQIVSGVLLLPLAAAAPLPSSLPLSVVLAVLALGMLCSGLAYMLYFRLVVDVGPSKALIVTFLSPPFGILWGWMLLDESITPQMLLGTVLVLAGTIGSIGTSKPPPATSPPPAAR